MTWRVDPGNWEQYKRVHLEPWPELIEEIQKVGIRNYSVFAFGTRAFAYFEVESGTAQEALEKLSSTVVKKSWDDEVTRFVLPEADDGAGVQFLQLERIFYCP